MIDILTNKENQKENRNYQEKEKLLDEKLHQEMKKEKEIKQALPDKGKAL